MKVINATPHTVTILDSNYNVTIEFPPSGMEIRLASKTVFITDVNPENSKETVRITKTQFFSTELPKKQAGTKYIVSQLVKHSFPDRDDLLVPAEVVRNKEGQIIGCLSLGI